MTLIVFLLMLVAVVASRPLLWRDPPGLYKPTIGRILFAGGYPDEGRPPLASVEVFDPRSGRFTEVAAMAMP